MADVLIRGLDEDVVAGLDAEARRADLSRNEYLKRYLAKEHRRPQRRTITAQDLERFSEVFADARDPEIMAAMWRHRPAG